MANKVYVTFQHFICVASCLHMNDMTFSNSVKPAEINFQIKMQCTYSLLSSDNKFSNTEEFKLELLQLARTRGRLDPGSCVSSESEGGGAQPSHWNLSRTPAVIDTPILQPSAKSPPHVCQTGKITESMEHTFSTQRDEALCPQ